MTLLSLAAAFLAGVYLGTGLEPPAAALGLFALSALLLTLLLVIMRLRPLPALLLLAVVLGALRVTAPLAAETELAAHHSQGPLRLDGVVVSDPEAAATSIRFRLQADRINPGDGWTPISGDVLVTMRESIELARLRDSPHVRYGDRLLLEGALEAPPELKGFDYPVFLARQGIGSVMSFPEGALLDEGQGTSFYRWLYTVRRNIAASVAEAVPEPQASVGQALLLGIRDSLPEDLVEDFRATGTSHLLAISGLHVGILLGLSLAASAWAFGRRGQHYLIAPLTLVSLYAFIAGMSPSVARAAIMGSVYLAALALGRPRSVLPALGLAAAVMVAASPAVLWSVSFQLSFAAMAGIALIAEPLSSRLMTAFRAPTDAGGSRTYVAFLSDAVAMTIAATVATLPLVAFYFQRVSLIGLPTTLLTLPALPPVLVTQAAAGVVGLVSPWVATPVGWVAWAATSYLTGVVDLLGRLPGASFETGRVAPLLVWAYHGLLALWYFSGSLRPASRARLTVSLAARLKTLRLPPTGRPVPMRVLLPSLAVAALVWIAALSLPDGRLHVTFADVGQGDAVFVTTPGGQHILVDGGPDPMGAARLLGARMPFWDRSIDLVVLTHPHADHVSGLTEALRRYNVARILERRVAYESQEHLAWHQAVDLEGATLTQARPGQVLSWGDGVSIEVLGPPERLLSGTESDVDNGSVVLRLVYGEVSFLLTGDIFREAEALLVADESAIDSDVLKVAHHGSRSSSSDVFLSSVSPDVAVISAGENNRFGHPHPDTVESLLRHVREDLLFLTSESGAVEFVTDGRRLEVRTER